MKFSSVFTGFFQLFNCFNNELMKFTVGFKLHCNKSSINFQSTNFYLKSYFIWSNYLGICSIFTPDLIFYLFIINFSINWFVTCLFVIVPFLTNHMLKLWLNVWIGRREWVRILPKIHSKLGIIFIFYYFYYFLLFSIKFSNPKAPITQNKPVNNQIKIRTLTQKISRHR